MAGHGILRNPGVSAIWVTRSYKIWRPPSGGLLLTLGDPERVEWSAEGRQATYSEVVESIESGAPLLFEQAFHDRDAAGALAELEKQVADVLPLLEGLSGREGHSPEQRGMSEAAMLSARAQERAWFALHLAETEYIRPAIRGEWPPEVDAPMHVRVRRLDPAATSRTREFGKIAGGGFSESVTFYEGARP